MPDTSFAQLRPAQPQVLHACQYPQSTRISASLVLFWPGEGGGPLPCQVACAADPAERRQRASQSGVGMKGVKPRPLRKSPQLTGEYLVLKHAQRFDQADVDAARARLIERGYDPE